MAAYFLRRLLLIVPTFIGVTLVVFMITRIVPGGPLEREIMRMRQGSKGGEGGAGSAGRGVTSVADLPKAQREQLKKQFHLDKPALAAYWLWLSDVVRLNLGDSYYYKKPVLSMIVSRFPVSLSFGVTGFVLAYLVCVPLGIAKALKHGGPFDLASSAIVFMGYSIPGWALGVLLLLFLATGKFFDVFPLGNVRSQSYSDLPAVVKWMETPEDVQDEFGTFQWENLSLASKAIDRAYFMTLPVLCYMIGGFATLTVLTKNSLMENLGQDYVRTAFAKGLAPRRVVYLHTLRNSLIPLATGMGGALGLMMAGSYLIEYVFNIDGIGRLGYDSLVNRDYAVVLGVLVLNTLALVFGNLLSDFLYAAIDPRIRFN